MTASSTVRTATSIADPNNPPNYLKPNLDSSVAITKSDSTVYDPPLLAIWVGGAGNVVVRTFADQTTVTLVGATAGQMIPICVDQILSTNTTATSMVGLF